MGANTTIHNCLMDDPDIVATVDFVIVAGSALLGLFLVAASIIGVHLGVQGRLEEAAFVGRAGAAAPAIAGLSARSLFRRTVLVCFIAPFTSFALSALVSAVTPGVPHLVLVAAELGLGLSVVAMTRSYGEVTKRIVREAEEGYSSFDTMPFGDSIRGLRTRVGSRDARPPLPLHPGERPPLDPEILDGVGSSLDLVPPHDDIAVPTEPPPLLPGIPSSDWLRRGWQLVGVSCTTWFLVALPAILMPSGGLRSWLMCAATTVAIGCGLTGVLVGYVGRSRAFQERRAGYTTLAADDQTTVWPRGSAEYAWQSLATYRLWHLDPRTGAVIRAPLDPSRVLRDPRVHSPLRLLLHPRARR
jgi:hypothetical protein